MGELIDDPIELSRVERAELHREDVDLSRVVMQVAEQLKKEDPDRVVDVVVQPGWVAGSYSVATEMSLAPMRS
jgi:hypothetical protein